MCVFVCVCWGVTGSWGGGVDALTCLYEPVYEDGYGDVYIHVCMKNACGMPTTLFTGYARVMHFIYKHYTRFMHVMQLWCAWVVCTLRLIRVQIAPPLPVSKNQQPTHATLRVNTARNVLTCRTDYEFRSGFRKPEKHARDHIKPHFQCMM